MASKKRKAANKPIATNKNDPDEGNSPPTKEKTKKTKTNVDDGPEVKDHKVMSTADGPHVALDTATHAAGKKSQSFKEKKAARMLSKMNDEKIILYYAKEKNITVGNKTKTALRAEVLEACECSFPELREIYQIQVNREEITSDVTKMSSL